MLGYTVALSEEATESLVMLFIIDVIDVLASVSNGNAPLDEFYTSSLVTDVSMW